MNFELKTKDCFTVQKRGDLIIHTRPYIYQYSNIIRNSYKFRVNYSQQSMSMAAKDETTWNVCCNDLSNELINQHLQTSRFISSWYVLIFDYLEVGSEKFEN